jgi:hypothetical protein
MPSIDRSDLSIHPVPLANLALTMAQPFRLDNTPVGTRVVVEFTGAEWTGERLLAKQKGAASADWLTVGPEGTGCLDFRFLIETHDGALVYVHGLGRNHALEFFDGGANYFSMSFETGDVRYTWLNRIQAIAKGRLQSDGSTIMFEVHELR